MQVWDSFRILAGVSEVEFGLYGLGRWGALVGQRLWIRECSFHGGRGGKGVYFDMED